MVPDVALLPTSTVEVVVVVTPEMLCAEGGVPDCKQMEAYLQNVRTLRNLLDVATGTPELPSSMMGLSIDGANAIESVLFAVDAARQTEEINKKDMIDRTAAAWHFSGDIYNGEVI